MREIRKIRIYIYVNWEYSKVFNIIWQKVKNVHGAYIKKKTYSGKLSIFVLEYIFLGQVSRVFANSPGDKDSTPGRVIAKTFKMLVDTSLLNTK